MVVGNPDEHRRQRDAPRQVDALVVGCDVEHQHAVDEPARGDAAHAGGGLLLGEEQDVVVEAPGGDGGREHECHVGRGVGVGPERLGEREDVGASPREHAGAGVGPVVELAHGLLDALPGLGGDRALAAQGVRHGADRYTGGLGHLVDLRHVGLHRLNVSIDRTGLYAGVEAFRKCFVEISNKWLVRPSRLAPHTVPALCCTCQQIIDDAERRIPHGQRAHPRRQVLLRPVDGRLQRHRPVRRPHAASARRGARRREARRARRLRPHLPRRRPVRVRVDGRRAPDADRPPEGRPRGHRHHRADGHHQPVQRPGVQGRRLHVERPRRAPLRAAQGAAQHRPRRRARREDVRDVGRPRGRRVRRRQGHPPGPRALPRGREPARRLRHRQGLRHPLRDRAEAERAPRRHPAADGRPRARLHRLARAPRARGPQPRGRPRADGGPQLRRRHRAGAVPRQALPHRPQRPARHQVRPGPGVRPRRPAQRVRARRPARERRPRRRPDLRGPAPLRLQAEPHRGRDRRVGLRRREHAHLPAAQGAGRGLPRRPRGAGGARGRQGVRARRGRRSARASRTTTCSPTARRSRTSTRPRTSAARASASCACSSSPPSTCSARAARPGPRPSRPTSPHSTRHTRSLPFQPDRRMQELPDDTPLHVGRHARGIREVPAFRPEAGDGRRGAWAGPNPKEAPWHSSPASTRRRSRARS